MLPSLLFIFFLEELFYFLRFSEIWNDWCSVVIEAQPDVFTDLQGGTGMKGVGGKERIVVGVVAQPWTRWGRVKGKGGKGWGEMWVYKKEKGMPITWIKKATAKLGHYYQNNARQCKWQCWALCCKVCAIPRCCVSVGTRFPAVWMWS